MNRPWLVHVSKAGQILSSREGTPAGVYAAVTNTRDGGLLIVGSRKSAGHDVLVVKLGADLNVQWEKTFGGSHEDLGMTVIELADGGFMVGADSYSTDGSVSVNNGGHGHHGCPGGHRDYLVLRLDGRGELLWSRSFSGTNHEYLSQIVAASDGSFYAFGRTESFDGDVTGFRGEYDGWLVKFSADGDLLWQSTTGGAMWDWGSNAVATPDGGVLVTGYYYSWDGDGEGNKGDYDYALVRFDKTGKRLWTRMFGGRVDDFAQGAVMLDDGSFFVAGGAVIKTRDGGVAIAAATESADGDFNRHGGRMDAWILRLISEDLSGAKSAVRPIPNPLRPVTRERKPAPLAAPELMWSRRLGGTGSQTVLDSPQALVVDQDGGYLAIGSDDTSAIEYKTNASGRVIWKRSYQGIPTSRLASSGAALARVASGGYALLVNQADDLHVVRVNAKGRVLWRRRLGGSAPDVGTTLVATRDGGFLVGGSAYSSDGEVKDDICGFDYWVVRLDAKGKVLWSRSVGGSSNDMLIQLTEAPNGDVALIGRTESFDGAAVGNFGMYDYMAARLTATGEVKWTRTYGGIDWEWGNSVVALKDGGFVFAGYSYTFDDFELGQIKCNHGEMDYWVTRVDANGNLVWQQCFGGSNYDLAYGLVETRDGGFALVGGSASNDGQVDGSHGWYDAWLVKMDSSGQLQWQKAVGGRGYDIGYALVETPDGGFTVLGESVRNGNGDFFLFEVK